MAVAVDGSIVRLALENVGQRGSALVADTSAHVPVAAGSVPATSLAWVAFYVLEAAVFSDLTANAKSPASGFEGVAFAAGTWLYGNFSTFTLASGSLIAYQGVAL